MLFLPVSPTAKSPEIWAVLDDLLAELRRVLGAGLAGVYLYGSLVTGDFVPDVSDIDLLVVSSSRLTDEEIEALSTMHRAVSQRYPEWDNRIDAVYLATEALQRFRSEDSAFPVISPGEPFHLRDEPLSDWLQNWYIIRESAVALAGMPARTFIPPITRRDFSEAIHRYQDELRGRLASPLSAGWESYIILTMCRNSYLSATGKPASKNQGAAWMKERHPEWSHLIDVALRWRQEREPGIRPPLADTKAFVDFVADRFFHTPEAPDRP